MHGRVYRLVSKHFYDTVMDANSTPEMLRSPLERVVLKSKLLDMGPPHAVLALAMDQPKLTDIKNTILTLKELGGLFRTCNEVLTENDGDLTFIGRVMAGLPVDIRVTRLILFGYCFSVLDECIIIGKCYVLVFSLLSYLSRNWLRKAVIAMFRTRFSEL